LKANINTDVRCAFGDYAQATRLVTKSLKSGSSQRTAAAIMLDHTNDQKGTYWAWDVETKCLFRASRFELLMIPDNLIEKINSIAEQEVLSGKSIKVKSKSKPQIRGDEVPAIEVNTKDNNTEGDIGTTDNVTENIFEDVDTDNNNNESIIADVNVTIDNDEIDDVNQLNAYELQKSEVLKSEVQMIDSNGNVNKLINIDNCACYNDLPRTEKFAHGMSIRKGEQVHGEAAGEAVRKELCQLVNKQVWKYENVQNRKNWRKELNPIRSSFIVNEKIDAAGNFIKVKGRLVGGGNTQDKELYDNLSSPTVSLESIFMLLGIFAHRDMDITTVDITGAYLEVKLLSDDHVYMIIGKDAAKYLIIVNPEAKKYVLPNGEILVKLLRALYGTIQAASLWYKKLSEVMIEAGFQMNDCDKCVFRKMINGVLIAVGFHVDDLLIGSDDPNSTDEFVKFLKGKFQAITVNTGKVHPYLGMLINKEKTNIITVGMLAYEKKITHEVIKDSRIKSPAGDDLFEMPDSPLLSKSDAENFHSWTAQLLYLAKRVRIEILLAVSVLCGRVKNPTKDDMKKLQRILTFLKNFPDVKIKFSKRSSLKLELWVDASFATHIDGTSRTGIIIMFAGGPIGVWTSKQKMVTRNSTEAELVGLTDGITHVLWNRNWIMWFFELKELYAIDVYQDNTAVISLQNTGQRTTHRTRHLGVRYFWGRELINDGIINVLFSRTINMIADIQTKPKHGKIFMRLWKISSGYIC
jgi:hypothetical protein